MIGIHGEALNALVVNSLPSRRRYCAVAYKGGKIETGVKGGLARLRHFQNGNKPVRSAFERLELIQGWKIRGKRLSPKEDTERGGIRGVIADPVNSIVPTAPAEVGGAEQAALPRVLSIDYKKIAGLAVGAACGQVRGLIRVHKRNARGIT